MIRYVTAPTRRITTVLACAALLAGVTACSSHHRASDATPTGTTSATVAASAAPSAATTPVSPATYKPPTNTCDLLDQAHLTTALGPDAGELTKPRLITSSVAVFGTCEHRFGPVGARRLVSLHVQIVKIGTAQGYYDGLRAADQKQNPLTDVPQLGQGAYAFTDPQTGPHLVMYDGNLYLILSVSPAAEGAPAPSEITAVLADSARYAAQQLRTP